MIMITNCMIWQVSESEFVSGYDFHLRSQFDARHAKLLEEASTVFKRLDVDRDDVLSIDELGRELTEMGMISAGIPKQRDVVQVDGRTGMISWEGRLHRVNTVKVIWADTQTTSKIICADEVKAYSEFEAFFSSLDTNLDGKLSESESVAGYDMFLRSQFEVHDRWRLPPELDREVSELVAQYSHLEMGDFTDLTCEEASRSDKQRREPPVSGN